MNREAGDPRRADKAGSMGNTSATQVAALILAAGLSSRFRAADPSTETKLVALFKGEPLVRHVAQAALASRAAPVIVVTGHAAGAVQRALEGLPVVFVHNPDFATGLASSLKAGVRALPSHAQGALILLGDMPKASAPAILERSIALFEGNPDCAAVAPTFRGAPGNPVLVGRRLFAAIDGLKGDQGARRLFAGAGVVEWEAGDDSVAFDIDGPQDLRR